MSEFFKIGRNRVPDDGSAISTSGKISLDAAGTPADHIRGDARQAVEATIATSTTRRGRPRKTATDGAADREALQAEVNRAVVAQLDALHDPKAWEALLCLPADAALTVTGNKRWNLENRERETLGVTGSAAARTMMITNPRALAFFMLASALFTVYVPRGVAQLKELREKEAKKEEPKQ